MSQVQQLLETLWQLVLLLLKLVTETLALGLTWSLLLFWFAWWLAGVNWKKAWPTLAQGAWVPVVLFWLVGSLVWAMIAPSNCNCLGVTLPNFWWQLLGVGLLVGSALFCGWLQGVFGWTPPEVTFEPADDAGQAHHGHGPEPGHGPEYGHVDTPPQAHH